MEVLRGLVTLRRVTNCLELFRRS